MASKSTVEEPVVSAESEAQKVDPNAQVIGSFSAPNDLTTPPVILKLVDDLNTIMKDDFSVKVFTPTSLVLASATHGDTIELAVHSPHLEPSVLTQLAMDTFKLRLRKVRGVERRRRQ